MRIRRLALALIATACATVASAAETGPAETCHETTGGQFGGTRMCVTSVLAAQAGNHYGPEHLMGSDGAWCEGMPGPGIGERITLHFKPPGRFRTVTLTNGYTRTDQTFSRNGRVKRATLETSRGYKTTLTLKDSKDDQRFRIPATTAAWIRLTILDVYPGTQGSDTCLSWFAVDFEEMNR